MTSLQALDSDELGTQRQGSETPQMERNWHNPGRAYKTALQILGHHGPPKMEARPGSHKLVEGREDN
jgi:hypothetical protein